MLGPELAVDIGVGIVTGVAGDNAPEAFCVGTGCAPPICLRFDSHSSRKDLFSRSAVGLGEAACVFVFALPNRSNISFSTTARGLPYFAEDSLTSASRN